MGSGNSKANPKYKYTSAGEGKLEDLSTVDFEKRWELFIQSLDVGPENVRQIEQLDPDQKQELLLNFESKISKGSAIHYVNQIRNLKPGKYSGKRFDRKNSENSMQILSATEVSLRTNDVKWVYEFLNSNGLDVLLDYMSRTLIMFLNLNYKCSDLKGISSIKADSVSRLSSFQLIESKSIRSHSNGDNPPRRQSLFQKLSKTNVTVNDTVKTSLHQGLKCMRALLNNQRGCEMAFEQSRVIDVIALCLLHPSYQTKTLVLETLAAVCLIVNGLEKVLSAFDYFKEVTGESRRFETLMSYFKEHETYKVDDYNIDFMVSCLQFINIVVHSGEDINLRVYLQQEFSLLGLDDFYKKLEEKSGERLQRQVQAYLGNRVDVALLLEDSETKEMYAQDLEKLEHNLYTMEESYQNRIMQLDNRINELRQDNDQLRNQKDEQYNENQTLRKKLTDNSSVSTLSDQVPQDVSKHIEGLETLLRDRNIPFKPLASTNQSNITPTLPPPPPAPPAPTPPAPPPPPPAPGRGPGAPPAPPPPPPGRLGTGVNNTQATPIRPPIQIKSKLPIFNWTVLKNQQLKGTIFVTMNDELLYDRLEFDDFERTFQLNPPANDMNSIVNGYDSIDADKGGKKKATEKKSLLDNNRHRCLGVLLRFLDQEKMVDGDTLCRRINQLDVSVDAADRMLYQLPTADDIKMYRKYEFSQKQAIGALSDEDRLLISLCKVERLQQKLEVVVYINNFNDTYAALSEKVMIITRASVSVRNSQKLKEILEIVLAYGNLMNSSRRGIMYGFKLQSLDLLTETRTTDKTVSVLQFIVHIINKKFPELISFMDEIKYVENACKVPLEVITVDVMSLAQGMNQIKDELSHQSSCDKLRSFFDAHNAKVTQLVENAKNAKETFMQAAEWFGERQNNPKPDEFFGIFHRFLDNFKKCYEELIKRQNNQRSSTIKQNPSESEATPKQKVKDENPKDIQKKLAQEARKKNRRVLNRTRQINGDGIMDEILAVLEDAPLQAEIHHKRSEKSAEEVF